MSLDEIWRLRAWASKDEIARFRMLCFLKRFDLGAGLARTIGATIGATSGGSCMTHPHQASHRQWRITESSQRTYADRTATEAS